MGLLTNVYGVLAHRWRTVGALLVLGAVIAAAWHYGNDFRLKSQKAEKQRMRGEVAEALAKAKRHHERKEYDECLNVLKSTTLKNAADRETLAEVERIRIQCEGALQWNHLAARYRKEGATVDLLAACDEFLASYPPIARGTDKESRIITNWRKERAFKDAMLSLEDADDWKGLLAKAERCITDPLTGEDEIAIVRKTMHKWLLTRGFPRKEPPVSLVGFQEAQTKTGQRLLGVFMLPPGTSSWRFWKKRPDFNAKPFGDVPLIPMQEMVRVPDTPRYVQWAEVFNDGVQFVVQRWGTQDEWREFAQRCKTASKEIAKYQKRWGSKSEHDLPCANWAKDFAEHALLAEQITERWADIAKILADGNVGKR